MQCPSCGAAASAGITSLSVTVTVCEHADHTASQPSQPACQLGGARRASTTYTAYDSAALHAVGLDVADWQALGTAEHQERHLATREGLQASALLFALPAGEASAEPAAPPLGDITPQQQSSPLSQRRQLGAKRVCSPPQQWGCSAMLVHM